MHTERNEQNPINGIKCMRSTGGKMGRGRTRNEMFAKEAGILNVLIDLEDRQLQLFSRVKRVARARILRRALQLKFEEESKRRTRCSYRYRNEVR